MAIRPINMIPGNILAKTELYRHLWFWGKGFIFILLLFVMFYLAQASKFTLQQKARYSDASIKVKVAGKIDKIQKDADNINALIQDLKLKSGLLATLTSRQQYYDILAVFAESFNDATWIDNLSITRGKENDKEKDKDKNKEQNKELDRSILMVGGFSLTHNTLGTFLESLSANRRIQDVVLVYAKKLEMVSGDKDFSDIIEFKLTCSIIKGSSK